MKQSHVYYTDTQIDRILYNIQENKMFENSLNILNSKIK